MRMIIPTHRAVGGLKVTAYVQTLTHHLARAQMSGGQNGHFYWKIRSDSSNLGARFFHS